MICFPNAKINLGLQIIGKRNDGYHEIASCLYPIALTDALEFHEAMSFEFKQSGTALDNSPQDNIIVKTYEFLKRKQPQIPPLYIHLLKKIPFGAGLGGGSADAAFFMREVLAYFNIDIPMAVQEEWIAEIGSDCAFFIQNRPALATGRGEILTPVEIDLSSFNIQLIAPNIHISTARAYAGLEIRKHQYSLKDVLNTDVAEWKNVLSNDFEHHIFQQEPKLAEIKDQLYAGGALYASLSGSGSSMYGIFAKNKKADITLDIGFSEFAC